MRAAIESTGSSFIDIAFRTYPPQLLCVSISDLGCSILSMQGDSKQMDAFVHVISFMCLSACVCAPQGLSACLNTLPTHLSFCKACIPIPLPRSHMHACAGGPIATAALSTPPTLPAPPPRNPGSGKKASKEDLSKLLVRMQRQDKTDIFRSPVTEDFVRPPPPPFAVVLCVACVARPCDCQR